MNHDNDEPFGHNHGNFIQITVLVREEVPKLSSRVGCYTVLTAILIVYSNSMEDVV